MKPQDGVQIRRAIENAQTGTTGRIAVRTIPDADVQAFERAVSEFENAGLPGHPGRNAALILIAPNARKYAVIGDQALHERVGDAFWAQVVQEMQPHLARGAIGHGIVHGVRRIGDALRTHFPDGVKA